MQHIPKKWEVIYKQTTEYEACTVYALRLQHQSHFYVQHRPVAQSRFRFRFGLFLCFLPFSIPLIVTVQTDRKQGEKRGKGNEQMTMRVF